MTYPDGSTDEVPVKVTVKDPRTDADKNDPTAKAQTVTPGSTPNAQDSIGNVADLPSGTTYEFKTPVDTATDGEKDATVVVTYPDGSKDEVPVKVTVKDPRSDADKNNPTAKAQTVTPGTTPNAQDSIGNVADLPSGTTYDFKTPVDTATDGEKDATVVVTYPDGSKDEVPVKVTVKTPSTDADNNTPVAKAQTVTPGSTPNAQDSIGNVGDLPNGTKFDFKTPVDTATDGEKDATVVVTYPDGSKDEVPVKVTVKTPSTDADKNNPTAKAQTVTPGTTPNAQDSIGNVGDLPNGTKFDFKTPVDTTTPGDKGTTVVVTYPDGSTDEVPVTIKVVDPRTDADKNTPVVKDQTVKPGDKPSAKDSIGNVDDLPKGTTVEFKTPVDTTTPGEKDATVVVTYPDGSKDEVPVKVTVKDPSAPATDADKNTPVSKDQTVKPGEKPKAEDSIDNLKDLPKGTTVAFKDPVDTTTPGDKAPTVVVTYPDGSKDEVPVKVTVKDPSAPAKPVVATDLTDKAGTKTPVEVSAEPGSTVALYDKDGNKIGEATADENGKATITPTVAIPAGNVTAKATDPAGNTSDASDPMVATTDTTAPAKPVVATDLTDKAGTKTPVEVSAEPGSKVELFDKDGNKIGEATADENGKAKITPTVAIPAGNVTAKATDPAGNTSDASDPMVATTDTTAPAKPVVATDLTDKAGTKTPVEVSAEPGSKVELFDKDGNKIGEATADENGKATITPTVAIPAGNVTAKATDPAGNTSDASDPMVATTDTTAPAKPVVATDLTDKAGTKTPVEVSAEPGSKVELFDKDGNKIGEATADENGKATITPTVAIPAGNVTAKATDPAGNTSDASDPMVATTDTTAPAKPVVATDLTDKAGTKTPVEVSAEPGSKVELFDKDGNKIGEATADENGKATITPTVAIPAGNVTAKATDPAGNTSDASDPMVATTDTTAPAKPVVATDLTDKAGTKTPVEVSAEPGSKVELFDKDGNKIGEATADENGKAKITPTVAIPAGNVTAKATDPAGNTSDASDPMVATTDTTAPAKPVANTVKAGDTAITGTAEAGSTVEVTLPDGSKVSAKAGQDGNFSVPVSGLKEGDTVSVTATDDAGNTSNPTSVTVGKGTDTIAPDAPVVNTVKAGTTAVTGTAEAGSTVEVTLPDGSKVSAKADQDGNFSVPVSGLKEGDTVSVTATDDAGNTSNPTSVTVGKGTDTIAPDAPVVNTVKAGTTAVTGTAEAGSTVEVTLPDGSKVSAKADQDGNFSVPVSGLKEGDTVSVTATDDAGNTSNPTSVTVGKGTDTIAPDAPVVNTDLTGKAGTRTPIDVIAEPGSKVELFDKDGNKIGEATADETGLAVVVPTVNIPEGSVTARATDLAGNVSGASAPMFATTSGTVDSFNNGKGSENTPTVVKPSLNGKVESSTTLANHMNLKARANISSTEKDASTLPETGDEVSIGGVVLGGILAAAGLGLVGKRKKED